MTTKQTEAVSVPKLVKITGELHGIFKRGTADVIQVGRLLRLAKDEVGHGEFLPWLEKEFSLSDKSAERYMATHKFMIDVAAPLLKSDKLSNLHLRPSALYQLVEMHSRGRTTEADIEAVLKEAAGNWIGTKRLQKILESLHPVDGTSESTSAAEPKIADRAPEITSEATADEATDTAASTEGAGGATGEAGGNESEQSTEKPPATAPRPKSAPSAKDEGNLTAFAANILNLKRLASGPAKKYAATALQAADLETVADFLRAVADLKQKRSAEISISAEASAEPREPEYVEAVTA